MSEAAVRVNVNPGIHLRETGSEGILYDTRSKKVHLLNDTASFIWRVCCDSPQKEEISASVSEAYKIPLEAARTDVEETLSTFTDLELIELG